jgi:amidophosphoribosyltransferase
VFDGDYITGDVSQAYLNKLAADRNDDAKSDRDTGQGQNSIVGMGNSQ